MARGGPQVRGLAPRHECPAISNTSGNATTPQRLDIPATMRSQILLYRHKDLLGDIFSA